MGYHRELEAAIESMKAMRRRGIRILPGGDYGFAWTPHGTNAKDLEYFVKHVGMSTMEALLSATAWGGPMMRMGEQLGQLREGCLADLLLVDGDPLADITVLQDKARILAVMKDGALPPRAAAAQPRAPHDPLGRLRRHAMASTRPLHQRPHPRRHRAAARTPAACWCRATASRRSAARRRRSRPTGATVIDGAGATLMPGMCEAHTHFSWNDAATLAAIQTMPLEEHVLWCAKVAKRYLEAGFTSCVGAACAKPRLDVVIRNAINAGQIPGPRYLAASQEITVPGGLGDETLPHLPFPEFSFGVNVNGADEMRKAVRMFLKYGVDSIKLNLSGDNFTPDVAGRDHLDDATPRWPRRWRRCACAASAARRMRARPPR